MPPPDLSPKGYVRIELDYCLSIDEVAMLLNKKFGDTLSFNREAKTTNGEVDRPGTHYSSHYWAGEVHVPGTPPGPSKKKKVEIGITDYEHFKKNGRGRRADHRHFYARGREAEIAFVIDCFMQAIPGVLWREAVPSPEVPLAPTPTPTPAPTPTPTTTLTPTPTLF